MIVLARRSFSLMLLAVLVLGHVARAAAQDTQPAPKPAPPETPSIRIGATLFADYTVQTTPKDVDADGNEFTPNQFNVQRAYLNVTGQLSRLIGFRITPDIARETGDGSSLSGSYTYRLKYAYAQFNLDEWMQRGTYARFGIQPTPWVAFIDDVYRYRFHGATMEDREGILASSDFGASFRYNFGRNHGDLHAGFYNGDNYNRLERNDQKALMVRATVRPLPDHAYLQGMRITGFYDHDAYVKSAERRRAILGVTYEHARVNAAANYLATTDQTRSSSAEIDGHGFTIWVTPKITSGWEALLRFDSLRPNEDLDARRQRTILGIAYWFPRQGSVTSALMFDFENVDNDAFVPSRADERRFAVHLLVNF